MAGMAGDLDVVGLLRVRVQYFNPLLSPSHGGDLERWGTPPCPPAGEKSPAPLIL
jgi:hypothetical protein